MARTRSGEGDEHAVPFGADFGAAMVSYGGAQQHAMAFEHLFIPMSEMPQQARRPFDIGEDKRYGPTRKRWLRSDPGWRAPPVAGTRSRLCSRRHHVCLESLQVGRRLEADLLDKITTEVLIGA